MDQIRNIGKVGIFWDDTKEPLSIRIGTLKQMYPFLTYAYRAENDLCWKNFMPLDEGVPDHLQSYIEVSPSFGKSPEPEVGQEGQIISFEKL